MDVMGFTLTHQKMAEKLGRVFPPEQTAALVEVLDAIRQMEIQRAADTRELKQGLAALTAEVGKLAQAQARTEERVGELAQAQARTEERVGGLEAAMERLTQAQARTEERVGELAQAQARTEERVGGLEAAMERLTQAQARTEERVGGLEAAMERLIEAQARTEERLARLEATVERLIEAQARTEETIRELIIAQERMDRDLGRLRGWQLEHTYQAKAYSYFGRLLRRARAVPLSEIEDELEQHLSDQEIADLIPLDLLVWGRPRHRPDVPEVWLAVEISGVVDRHDVERAQQRAAILRRAGYRAIPTVAGEGITESAENIAQEEHILVLQDGRHEFWEEALQAALSA